MAKKKIRFTLEMKDGVQARILEDVKKHFSLEKVLVYIEDGRMDTWLRERYQNNIADGIAALDKADSDYNKKLYALFGVDYDEADVEEMAKAAERAEKLKKLREYTDEQNYLDNADYVAFEQDDLYDLLDEGATTIYLCGKRFEIPLEKSGITYIGVNNPTVVINSKSVVDWKSKDISLDSVKYDEKYQAVIDADNAKKLAEAEAQRKKHVTWQEEFGEYTPSPLTSKTIEKYFYVGTAKELTGLHYDCENSSISKFSKMVQDIGRDFVSSIDFCYGSSSSLYPENNYSYRNNKSAYTFQINEELRVIFPMEEVNEYARVIIDNAVVFAANPMINTLSHSGYSEQVKTSSPWLNPIRKLLYYSADCPPNQYPSADYIAARYGIDLTNGRFNLAGCMFIFWALMILTVDDSQKDKLSVICELASMMHVDSAAMCDIINIIRLVYGEKMTTIIRLNCVKAAFVLVLRKYGYTD